MDELRHVKSDAVKMKTKIQEANEVIKDTGGKLLETGKELKMVHAMQLNVYSTMDVLTRCIPGEISYWCCVLDMLLFIPCVVYLQCVIVGYHPFSCTSKYSHIRSLGDVLPVGG